MLHFLSKKYFFRGRFSQPFWLGGSKADGWGSNLWRPDQRHRVAPRSFERSASAPHTVQLSKLPVESGNSRVSSAKAASPDPSRSGHRTRRESGPELSRRLVAAVTPGPSSSFGPIGGSAPGDRFIPTCRTAEAVEGR